MHAAVIEELQISSGRYFCTFKNFPQFSKRLGFIQSGCNVIDHLLESNQIGFQWLILLLSSKYIVNRKFVRN